jgi:hypothetical protein
MQRRSAEPTGFLPRAAPLRLTLPTVCAGCALTAMAGATAARTWLQAQPMTWLTPKRMKVATVAIFAAAALGSSVTLGGSTPPPSAAHDHAAAPPAAQAQR